MRDTNLEGKTTMIFYFSITMSLKVIICEIYSHLWRFHDCFLLASCLFWVFIIALTLFWCFQHYFFLFLRLFHDSTLALLRCFKFQPFLAPFIRSVFWQEESAFAFTMQRLVQWHSASTHPEKYLIPLLKLISKNTVIVG